MNNNTFRLNYNEVDDFVTIEANVQPKMFNLFNIQESKENKEFKESKDNKENRDNNILSTNSLNFSKSKDSSSFKDYKSSFINDLFSNKKDNNNECFLNMNLNTNNDLLMGIKLDFNTPKDKVDNLLLDENNVEISMSRMSKDLRHSIVSNALTVEEGNEIVREPSENTIKIIDLNSINKITHQKSPPSTLCNYFINSNCNNNENENENQDNEVNSPRIRTKSFNCVNSKGNIIKQLFI